MAQGKLSYLKMVTPRRPDDASSLPSSAAAGLTASAAAHKRFVVFEGEVREISEEALADVVGRPESKARWASFAGSALDPEAVRRHEAQMRRFRFGGRPAGGRPG